MNVVTVFCESEKLQETIQEAKNANRRILAVSPSRMKKSGKSQDYEVIQFVVISQ